MSKIEYSKKAFKTLRKMDRKTAQQLVRKISQLVENPESLKNNLDTLKMKEGSRLRVGDFRIVFTVQGNTIYIIKIGDRKDIYKR